MARTCRVLNPHGYRSARAGAAILHARVTPIRSRHLANGTMAPPNQMRQTIRAARPWFSEQEIAAILPSVEAVLESGQLILGEHTEAVEDAFKQFVGSDYAATVNSCSSAIQIALRFFLAAGRERILPTNKV